jgi:hypothetical protein
LFLRRFVLSAEDITLKNSSYLEIISKRNISVSPRFYTPNSEPPQSESPSYTYNNNRSDSVVPLPLVEGNYSLFFIMKTIIGILTRSELHLVWENYVREEEVRKKRMKEMASLNEYMINFIITLL